MHTAFVTRFAPSPTGKLHLGHAFSALTAFEAAQKAGGRFLLRIEDIDQSRCRDPYISGIFEDLEWLGITWERPVRRQSEHFSDYQSALDRLKSMGVLYKCICTRKDIAAEIARSPSAPHGPDGAHYPGTCKHRPATEIAQAISDGHPFALRLDSMRAAKLIAAHSPLLFTDNEGHVHEADPLAFGDVVLARKDTPTSYHLAVTVDDALQGISHVVRGEDLFHATHIHRTLQAIFGLPSPVYHHHKLLLNETGRRLAKRDKAQTLHSLRQSGWTAQDVRERLDRLSANC
ncbi:tRNA glutamyl-Q(34) synthetase GluQRS [Iodidimonas gelatinilytica]|uniref:tRNA glutamyl-Q(34) synthetase GluQRS n=1 Tax=Iodidimonas gelatinilytica TaxID=1236966 RepID=A0A5A7MMV2_9PROT|nr:tRNA glutamyl-Q(34) synthetase GluQRS [Iodidimonas gelatinilytica]GEQ97166.1 tRNA glutamyl-Q(34) synthetase GluQRS [Iodidimonas gelatinilytica]